mmetsp:Transcript_22066/g.37846  ORF Transcript_22066/g.37846 Transcript_22066/m.37846 type:complete len:345 (+) Transcript_22066:229-1263(+)
MRYYPGTMNRQKNAPRYLHFNLGMGLIALFSLFANVYTISILIRIDSSTGQGANEIFPFGATKEWGATLIETGIKSPSNSGDGDTQSQTRRTLSEETPMPWPKPDDWEIFGYYKTRHHFQCKEYAHDRTKALPSLEDWKYFRNVYKKFVDKTARFDDPVPPTMGYTLSKMLGPAPIYAAYSDKGGRGLFASRDIKKGELVLDGNQSDFSFPDAMAWRRFIFNLPRDKACDMIDWAWTQQTEKGGKTKVLSAINISILLNSHKTYYNVIPKSSYSQKMYATRDIKKDEELLGDYSIYRTTWNKVGLGYAKDHIKETKKWKRLKSRLEVDETGREHLRMFLNVLEE